MSEVNESEDEIRVYCSCGNEICELCGCCHCCTEVRNVEEEI
jgi:hypothetical protein